MQLFLLQAQAVNFLPLWVQILLLIITAVALFFQWRSSLAIKEHSLVKEHCERLQTEVRKLTTDKAILETRTNLEPLVNSFQAWQTETRENFQKAMTRLEEIRSENINAMQTGQSVLKGMLEALERLEKNHGNQTQN